MEDYEKKYKNALEWARRVINGEVGFVRNEVEEEIFPELKESEDERIRKDIISFLRSKSGYGYMTPYEDWDFHNRWLPWLEKQGKSSDQIHYWTEEEIEPIINDYLRGVEHYGGMIGRLRCLKPKSLEKQVNCSAKWQKNTPHNKPAINHSVLMKTTQGIAEGEWQGEDWFQYRWSWTLKDSDVLAWMELSDLDEQGEQKPIVDFKAKDWYVSKVDGKIHDMTYNSTDRAEPKFKVGDFIVNDYCVGRVVEITNNAYLLDTGQGIPFSCEDNMHLWTIEDAKDGDVLCWDESKCIALFKNIDDKESFNSYGFVGHCTGTFETRLSYHDIEGAHPATKEQRDLLFQKMREAGYEWNAEKKELKKLTQSVTKKSDKVWSEEDEEMTEDLIKGCISAEKAHHFVHTSKEIADWLKSLKDRNTWKPSEKQIEALHNLNLIGKIDYAGQAQALIELYNNLKKL